MPFCHIVQHSKCTRWCSSWRSSSSTPLDQQLWPAVCQSTNALNKQDISCQGHVGMHKHTHINCAAQKAFTWPYELLLCSAGSVCMWVCCAESKIKGVCEAERISVLMLSHVRHQTCVTRESDNCVWLVNTSKMISLNPKKVWIIGQYLSFWNKLHLQMYWC